MEVLNMLMEIISESILTIVGALAAALLAYLAPKLKRQLAIWADKDNLGIIEAVVDMAVELAEDELKGRAGKEKFDRAMTFTAEMLKRYGIDVSSDFLKGAIQKGYKRMKEEDKKHG